MNKRILIIRNAYQQDTGGAEQYAFNLALALKNAGHTPVIVTKHEAIHEKCKSENINYIKGVWYDGQEWDRKYYLRHVFTSAWYLWIILKYRIDVVNPQSRDDFVFATHAGRLLRRRVVWTDHADLKYIMDRTNHPHPRMQSWVLKAAKYVHKIVCVSSSEEKAIVAVAPELKNKLTVVHNGVFLPNSIAPVDKKNSFVIGTNARLVPAKGISELLEAFAMATKIKSELELWLLGGLSGNEEKYSKEAATLGIENRVKFLGYVPNPNDYVASMDIFIHASYHEGFSLAVIEACMLKRPIIATKVGGTPEIIDNTTGILVPAKNAQAIFMAIEKLLKDSELRDKLAKSAYNRAINDFDFQKIVENNLVPIYEGVST